MGKRIHQNRHPKKAAFLAAFRKTASVRSSAVVAKIDRTTHYLWLRTDEAYCADFALAEEDAIDALESEARRRALEGTERMVLYKGEPVMVADPKTGKRHPLIEREFSDVLTIFLLKAANPAKYRENSAIDITSGGKPIKAYRDIDDGEPPAPILPVIPATGG